MFVGGTPRNWKLKRSSHFYRVAVSGLMCKKDTAISSPYDLTSSTGIDRRAVATQMFSPKVPPSGVPLLAHPTAFGKKSWVVVFYFFSLCHQRVCKMRDDSSTVVV